MRFAMQMKRLKELVFQSLTLSPAFVALWALTVAPIGEARAQQSQQSNQQSGQQQDQTAPDAGGPSGDNGSIALPKKTENPDDNPPPAPAEPKFKNPEGTPNMSLRRGA
jgi:hypothetical protein